MVDLPARKKLFRPQTAASPRLEEEDELVGDGVHGNLSLDVYPAKPNPDCRVRQGTTPSPTE
ncbi:MAG: hypothetical protein ACREIB_00410 [Pseudomonadota bacterium]